ncbi:MAG TPA: hypothetical protein VJR69_03325 [Nitrospira sp.]|nr:hypothetical protein [Nitrospira sp.]
MNTEKYKRQLKAKEQDLLVQLTRAGQRARESSDDTARDPGDESVADEQKTNSSEVATSTVQR